MGFGKFLKGLVGGGDHQVAAPERTLANSDDELIELWRDRGSLTPGSRDDLWLEFGIRSLVIPVDRPDPRSWLTLVVPPELSPKPSDDGSDDDPKVDGDPTVQLLSTWLVAIQPTPDVTLAVSLPTWTAEPAPLDIPAGMRAVALVGLGVVPPGTAAAVGAEDVIDGLPGEPMTYGSASVDPMSDGVLIRGETARVMVGAAITLAEIAKHRPTHVVGGIRWPESDEEWAGVVAAWTPETVAQLGGVWVMSDMVGAAAQTSLSLADKMGVPAFLVASQLPVSVQSEALVTAAHKGDAAVLESLGTEAGSDALIEAMAHALFRGAYAEAELVLAAADKADVGAGVVAFAQGEIASLRDSDEAAAKRFYREAVEAGHGLARCSLAAMTCADLDDAELMAEVDAAAEALSTDIAGGQDGETRRIVSHPIAVEGQILSRWAAGEYDEAHRLFEDGQLELTPWTRQHIEVLLDEGNPDVDPLVLRRPRWFTRPAFVMAWWLLEQNGTARARALALKLLRRALELSPLSAEAAVTLADELAADGEASEALEILDALLEQQPFHLPVLLVRAELRQKYGDSAGAVADWKTALEWSEDVKPWVDLNLGVGLIDAGRIDDAKAHIKALDIYLDDRIIDALRHRLQSST